MLNKVNLPENIVISMIYSRATDNFITAYFFMDEGTCLPYSSPYFVENAFFGSLISEMANKMWTVERLRHDGIINHPSIRVNIIDNLQVNINAHNQYYWSIFLSTFLFSRSCASVLYISSCKSRFTMINKKKSLGSHPSTVNEKYKKMLINKMFGHTKTMG